MTHQEPTADALLKAADELFQDRDLAAAQEQYHEAYRRAREEFNRPVEVEAACQMARMCLVLGKAQEGRDWLSEASSKATDSDLMGWSRYLGVKGRFEWKAQELDAARSTFLQMYSYCKLNEIGSRAVDAANMCAIVAATPEEQIEWSHRGIEMAENSESEQWLGPLWNNLAATHFDIKQYSEALTCYLKAREFHWRFSDERAKLMADYQIGMTYRLLEKHDEAARWLRPSLAWAERLEDYDAIRQVSQDLAEVEIAKGNAQSGLNLLVQSRDACERARDPHEASEIWKVLTERIQQLRENLPGQDRS